MLFWIVNFLVFYLYAVLMKRAGKNELFLIIACIHIGMIAVFRGVNVGTDTGHYTRAFNQIIHTGSAGRHIMTTSAVFYQYMKIIAKLLPYENAYIVLTALPTNFCLAYFLKKNSINYFESLYLYCAFYFYFYSMNAARQFLGIGLIMVCYCLMQKRKKMLGCLLWLLACNVHSSAVFFGIYILASYVEWNGKRLKYALLIIAIGSSILLELVDSFVAIYPQYESFAMNLQADYITSKGRSSLVYAIYCMIAVVIAYLGLLYDERKLTLKFGNRFLMRHLDEEGKNAEVRQKICELIIVVYASGCVFLLYPTYIMFWRMAYVGFLFIILLLPYAVNHIKYVGKLFKWVVYIPIFILMFMQIAGNYSDVKDYCIYIR